MRVTSYLISIIYAVLKTEYIKQLAGMSTRQYRLFQHGRDFPEINGGNQICRNWRQRILFILGHQGHVNWYAAALRAGSNNAISYRK